jgi:hypothetical protein
MPTSRRTAQPAPPRSHRGQGPMAVWRNAHSHMGEIIESPCRNGVALIDE